MWHIIWKLSTKATTFLHTSSPSKICTQSYGPQSCESPNCENFETPKTKWHLGAGPMAKHRVYYKGEDGGFLQVQVVISLVNPCLLVVSLCTKVLQVRINQLVIWFVQVRVNCLSIFLIPFRSSNTALYPRNVKGMHLLFLFFFVIFSKKFLNSKLNIYFGPRFVIWPTTFDIAIYEKKIDL